MRLTILAHLVNETTGEVASATVLPALVVQSVEMIKVEEDFYRLTGKTAAEVQEGWMADLESAEAAAPPAPVLLEDPVPATGGAENPIPAADPAGPVPSSSEPVSLPPGSAPAPAPLEAGAIVRINVPGSPVHNERLKITGPYLDRGPDWYLADYIDGADAGGSCSIHLGQCVPE